MANTSECPRCGMYSIITDENDFQYDHNTGIRKIRIKCSNCGYSPGYVGSGGIGS